MVPLLRAPVSVAALLRVAPVELVLPARGAGGASGRVHRRWPSMGTHACLLVRFVLVLVLVLVFVFCVLCLASCVLDLCLVFCDLYFC